MQYIRFLKNNLQRLIFAVIITIITMIIIIFFVFFYKKNKDKSIKNKTFEWRFENWSDPINWELWNANKYMINASQIDTYKDPLSSKKVMRVTYPKGSFGLDWPGHSDYGGAQFISSPRFLSEFDDDAYVRLEYKFMFEKSFDWVNGGKLPGLYGGEGKCTGVETKTNCYSTRYMWRSSGDLEIFPYVSKPLMSYMCGKFNGLKKVDIPFIKISNGSLNQCNSNSGVSIGRGGLFNTIAGKWTNLTQIVKMNKIGKQDGTLQVFINGNSVVSTNQFVFRDSNIVKTNSILFSTFFGGGEPIYQASKNEFSYWDSFVLTASYEHIWN
ncbi:MAG: hypothetical protein AM1032_000060 [Mycoplasmataceae bacterium]|nr:MAG: hypothetical protein AM1032_000060 [Mycoplasmataceae bacterium]